MKAFHILTQDQTPLGADERHELWKSRNPRWLALKVATSGLSGELSARVLCRYMAHEIEHDPAGIIEDIKAGIIEAVIYDFTAMELREVADSAQNQLNYMSENVRSSNYSEKQFLEITSLFVWLNTLAKEKAWDEQQAESDRRHAEREAKREERDNSRHLRIARNAARRSRKNRTPSP